MAAANAPRSRISGHYGTPLRGGLFRLDISGPDHLGPLLGFFGDELSEVGGRATEHCASKIDKPRLDLGIGERRVEFLVELVDDLSGRVAGCADAIPCAGFKSRQKIADGRNVR